MRTALLLLGGNLPLRRRVPTETLRQALRLLSDPPGRLVAVSRFYRSPAHPPGAGPDFVNAAAAFDTAEAAPAVLARLHRIEEALGRRRDTGRWGARVIDIDLLALGDDVRPNAAGQDRWRALSESDQQRLTPEELILPHPRLQDRAFALVPLAEIAPLWVHPRLGLDVTSMLARLPSEARAAVQPLTCK
ncbi:2-amino-4-hydroxy-6-hydroxymethyldihydropteridine diphosphokinase [Paracoccus sp. S-4012]|uniref:2-amino-4-hydroxy-6- hydroxymethyldihydropteridine diphosphokinase n=1 Tax=Paracoccus sp. S-4012 TaxID=2665648 RepID=UPI00351B50ED